MVRILERVLRDPPRAEVKFLTVWGLQRQGVCYLNMFGDPDWYKYACGYK